MIGSKNNNNDNEKEAREKQVMCNTMLIIHWLISSSSPTSEPVLANFSQSVYWA